jgi:carbon-monoxide dehydrogenase medium subunit
MRIEELEYLDPETLDEACDHLDRLGGKARVLAGGTDVLADLKQGNLTAQYLISLSRIAELHKIASRKGSLWIGPMVTPNELADSAKVRKVCPALADAGASMAGVQIRNLASLGGNLCSAVPSADLPPSLMTVEAELLLASKAGQRQVPIREFFLAPRKTALRKDEILAGIMIPALPPGTGSAYEKYQLRAASALAVLGCAARLTVHKGKITKALVCVGAAAPIPLLIEKAGAFLKGKAPSKKNFDQAGLLAEKGVKPITDHRGSETFRRDLARVLTTRSLERAFERIQS